MKDYEFYAKYANVPASDRSELITMSEGGLLELSEVYRDVSRMDDEIRRLAERKRMKIADSEEFILAHQAGKK